MTVKELIEKLSTFDPEMKAIFICDHCEVDYQHIDLRESEIPTKWDPEINGYLKELCVVLG
jgi:hypothetical protein